MLDKPSAQALTEQCNCICHDVRSIYVVDVFEKLACQSEQSSMVG